MPQNDHAFIFDITGGKKPTTARKAHICRLYDLLQLCIQRNDLQRARRAWSILSRCKEINWKVMWRTGLVLTRGVDNDLQSVPEEEERLEYLATMMLQYPEARESLIQEVILRLILTEKHRKALEELELYLPSLPYQDNATLHVYAGLVCIYLAQPETSGHIKRTLAWNDGLVRQAQQYLERAHLLDPEDVVAKTWISKLPLLSRPASPQRSEAPDSDEDTITVTATEDDQRPKRARQELSF